ncbi:hypothetical protein RhiirA4_431801 [Rhizophagus irregularis]|uniref:Uncharacterized protein n=1 Tax=Rhizophagus irregularis TaxID=588596 RepID=A0A2I1HRA1_9GLOM|nr:hypothetical protein RhiirA4_431801 [Rhizophagus irregularis]
MECSLDDQDIKLSEPVVVVYNNKNMENMKRNSYMRSVVVLREQQERTLLADSLHGSWNNSSRFQDDSKQFFAVSGRFLDNSLPDDLNNIIFFMAFEQFLGETSWFFGWET